MFGFSLNNKGRIATTGTTVPVDTEAQFLADTRTVIFFVKANDAADYTLVGPDVSELVNYGVSGCTVTATSNRPAHNAADNTLDFDSANSERMLMDIPLILDCDKGYTMFIGLDPAANDRYVFGTTVAGGANMFSRAASINLLWTTITSRIFSYSGWDTAKPGKFVLEITVLQGGTALLRMNNGVSSTGNAGTLHNDITFFDAIGFSLSTYYTGQAVPMIIFDAPITDDTERTDAYNDFLTQTEFTPD